MKLSKDSSAGYPNRNADTLVSVAQLDSPINGRRFGRRKAMSEIGLGAVLLMIGMIMLMLCYWKQIAIFLLFVIVTVFGFGIYYIVNIICIFLTNLDKS
jgi:hypothetical protein